MSMMDEIRAPEAMTIKHMSEEIRLEHDVRPRRLFVDGLFAASLQRRICENRH